MGIPSFHQNTLAAWRGGDEDKCVKLTSARLPRLVLTTVGRLSFERQGDAILAMISHSLRNISLHRLDLLMARVVGEMPRVDLRYDHEWMWATQTHNGVESIVRDLHTGEEILKVS